MDTTLGRFWAAQIVADSWKKMDCTIQLRADSLLRDTCNSELFLPFFIAQVRKVVQHNYKVSPETFIRDKRPNMRSSNSPVLNFGHEINTEYCCIERKQQSSTSSIRSGRNNFRSNPFDCEPLFFVKRSFLRPAAGLNRQGNVLAGKRQLAWSSGRTPFLSSDMRLMYRTENPVMNASTPARWVPEIQEKYSMDPEHI
jgi:hypothetical protein